MAETITTDNKSTLLYRFLVSPELRWARYLVLIMVLATISFNQVFIIFLDYRDILGGWIYTFTFLYLLTYIGVIYLNLFWLFPKFLLKRRYLTYISLLSVAMMLALAIQMATEYVSYSCWPEFYERASYFSIPIVMDYISSFMLSTLCMIGGTMTVLLKEWMIDHQRVSQMEGSRSFGSGTAKRTSQPRTSFQNIASFGRTDIERTGKSFEDADEIKSTTSLSAI